MTDPERDFGILYDDQGFIQILQSPFFDVDPEVEHTVNDYIERILETVVMAIEDQLGTVEWRLATSPNGLGWMDPGVNKGDSLGIQGEANLVLAPLVSLDRSRCHHQASIRLIRDGSLILAPLVPLFNKWWVLLNGAEKSHTP
ncbi:hypothetical protein M5K25_013250 [Dendrobium thyrsiflorum]|uniref:Uncharacterized protein n=1 Tax=Dendrobium thyrsiflorum TaxID=117978 RepID=A0ABD0UT05_DENTH